LCYPVPITATVGDWFFFILIAEASRKGMMKVIERREIRVIAGFI
jgi:hypothetical protein